MSILLFGSQALDTLSNSIIQDLAAGKISEKPLCSDTQRPLR